MTPEQSALSAPGALALSRQRVARQLGRGPAQQDAAYERLAVLAMQARFTLRPSLVGDGGRREKVFSHLISRQLTPPRPPGFRHLPNVTRSERISYSLRAGTTVTDAA